MAKADEAPWIQRFVKGLRSRRARDVVKIDQQVTAKDDIEVAVVECIGGLGEINPGELDRLPQIVAELIFVACALEVFPQPSRRHILHRAGRIAAGARTAQDAGIYIRRDDL